MTEIIRNINMNDIRIGVDGFNVRPLDENMVDRYQEVLEKLPPIEGWQDPDTSDIYLVDGRHRYEAWERAGYDTVAVRMLDCSRVDAEVRAYSANLTHPLPLTKLQRRLAITEIVRRRYTRSNNWIAEEAACSSQTVAKIREELEEKGKIPILDRLERKSGGTTPREFNRVNTNDGDSLFGNAPDFFDEVEEQEAQKRQQEQDERETVKAPSDLKRADRTTQDGGYDVGADGDDDTDEFESNAGPLITGLEKRDNFKGIPGSQATGTRTLKFAHLKETDVALDVIIYIDGRPHNLPVTLMVSDGAISGMPDVSLSENQQAALVVQADLAQKLKLIY